MNEQEIEGLLQALLLEVPRDFESRVLLAARSRPQARALRPWQQALQWLAWFSGGTLALSQLLGFIFGLWLSTNAH